MKKILYTASTDIHIINFHIPYLKWFKDHGFEVHVACNGNKQIPFADKVFKLPFERSPFNKRNLDTYRLLQRLMTENEYELIHCHTPTCGVLTRLAARKARKRGAKVLYTAHGFHFYKGASFRNWLVFYPIELFLSTISDGIITMNREDYKNLNSPLFRTKGKFFIDGIGINPERISRSSNESINTRSRLNIQRDQTVILYIAEFNKRKNHIFLFNCMEELFEQYPNTVFLFAGGFSSEKEHLEEFAKKKGFYSKLRFLGYQSNIGEFIEVADIGVSSSLSEGLPIGIAELMYSGLPVVVSKIRGHVELVENGRNGYIFDLSSEKEFMNSIAVLLSSVEMRNEIGRNARESMTKFLLPTPVSQMDAIYKKYVRV